MKKLYIATFLLVSFWAGIHLSAFQLASPDPATQAIANIRNNFHHSADAFLASIDAYVHQLEAYESGKITLAQLQSTHLNTRLAFKSAAFLLEYNDSYSVKKSLNGPPLLSLEPYVPEVRVVAPKGLQVLDELVFENAPLDAAVVSELLHVLQKDATAIITYQKKLVLQHRHVMEAIRYDLIRIYTLGLTGFDTPGSLNALPESAASLESLYLALREYKPLLQERAPHLGVEIERLFPNALQKIRNHADFDTFDRLTFYRESLQPMLSLVWQIQATLGIETVDETTSTPQSLQSAYYPLFDTDIFNRNYYRSFDADERYEFKVALGRLLFYDPILSANNERSCQSCHRPELAFTDGRTKSLAFDGENSIQRNAPGLINSVFTEKYFYDLREPQLERQVKHVILDKDEFHTDFVEISEKLALSETYQQLFVEAYPQAGISKYSISNALAAYVSELVSFDSPFDRYARGESEELTESAKRGFNLFMGKGACATCHFAPTFSGLVPPYYIESESEVLGVPVHPDSLIIDPDLGRMANTRPSDESGIYAYSFKTTTVRNTALTAPYMHNGAYSTLDAVMDFYNKGGGQGLGIDVPHQTLAADPLNLTAQETADLIAFLNSLTDVSAVGEAPQQLPLFEQHPSWNTRKVGGTY